MLLFGADIHFTRIASSLVAMILLMKGATFTHVSQYTGASFDKRGQQISDVRDGTIIQTIYEVILIPDIDC